MKFRAYCFSALVVWILVFLTMLSFSIEQWMMPAVYQTGGGRGQGGYPTLAREAVLFEKIGVSPTVHTVFEIKESGGNTTQTMVEAKDVQLQASPYSSKKVISFSSLPERCVKFSSKPLQGGEKVTVVERHSGQPEDHWLIFSDDKIKRLPAELSNEATGEGVELVTAKTAYPVFAEDIAKSMLLTDRRTLPEGLAVYSLSDTERFFTSIPWLASIFSLLIFALIVWVLSFRLSKNPKKYKQLLCVNGGIEVTLLAGIILLLRFVNLPSSLMPVENIFDIGHYTQEFSRIFSALQDFSTSGNATASSALSQSRAMLWISLGILVVGIVIGMGVFFLEVSREPRLREKHTPMHRASRT